MRYYGFKKAKNKKIDEHHEAFHRANMFLAAPLKRKI